MKGGPRFTRRRFFRLLGGIGAALYLQPGSGAMDTGVLIKKAIPASGELLPVIGMGTWITFDAGDDEGARARLRPVLQAFFDYGGQVIDSSPMYGSSEEVLGDLLPQVTHTQPLFAATKVWTPGRWFGVKQMEASQRLWGVPRFDLMQIHNMLDWEAHLETLKAWKAEGRIRYIGITTSHGRRHEAMEKVISTQSFDFVQFSYNIVDREVESRLLPLAAERKIAVIINRPFQTGALFKQVKDKRLPDWAREFDCTTWSQYFLKFIVSHPAVTCTIPATSNPEHMIENMGGLTGRLPDAELRQRMVQYFQAG